MKTGDEVLVDTNAIIAAFRLKVWKPLSKSFQLLTAEQCLVEAATGNQRRKDYVRVDDALVRQTATILRPNQKTVATLTLSLPPGLFLDPGERDLIACALDRPGSWSLCSPDKAAIRAMHTLKRLSQMVSLETLVQTAKIGVRLEDPLTEKWLSGVRTNLELGIL